MPDVAPIGADTLVIDMVRRFATERLAPRAAARCDRSSQRRLW